MRAEVQTLDFRRPRVVSLAEVGEWNRWHAYFTPTAVVQQGLLVLALLFRELGLRPPRRVADLGAGAGAFGMVAGQVWAPRRLAIEARASELPWLERNNDQVLIAELVAALSTLRAFEPDLVVSNPPFPDVLDFLIAALSCRCWALFLVRASLGDDIDVYDWLEAHPPALDLAIGGRPNMRPHGSLSRRGLPQTGDNTAHRWLLWGPAGAARWTVRLQLPRLPPTLLSWWERPGEEAVPPPLLPDHLVGRVNPEALLSTYRRSPESGLLALAGGSHG